jgi:hypothetical protein
VLAGTTPVLVHNCGEDIYDTQGRQKHGSAERNTQRGVSGAEPQDGQASLDDSVEFSPETDSTPPRRLSTVNNEFVVLDRTEVRACGCTIPGGTNNIWHGHVRSWDNLHTKMQGFLRKMKMANGKGRIIG